jgi:hypothetical protein
MDGAVWKRRGIRQSVLKPLILLDTLKGTFASDET